ncbi:phosphotransferase [Cellulomonas bogoriensis]|uniref:Kinase n=1 Tax=Cellulomonas bogoriensis 69B4 = DSM 16987 TaxID=1386082 RepID=A0A0A0C0S1_9CELL|nr:phosphotransferase [Cellulomonas bogoriensis]KGM13791.1 kinase [Cellulomonas bogoriensis 69B4 = DSM 16987]
MAVEEVPLTGGNVTGGVVRVGRTVRRPAGPQTPAVHAVLTHLQEVGFAHAPRSHGIDERGRHVLDFVPGVMAHPTGPGVPPVDAGAVGRLLRDLHDALQGWVPPADAVWACPIPTDGQDLVVHNDVAPWNLVVAADRLVLIDWDGCAPGTRTWDLAYAAHGVVPLEPATGWGDVVGRLRGLADGYGLDEAGRHRLVDTLPARTWSMHALLQEGHRTGTQPWARLWDEGHGLIWRRDATWTEEHQERLRAALLT